METRLKERLVGAIVLVAIVVIVVPELLTGPRSRSPAPAPAETPATPVRTVTIDLASGPKTGPHESDPQTSTPPGEPVRLASASAGATTTAASAPPVVASPAPKSVPPGASEPAEATEAPATEPPATKPPATKSPATKPPATKAAAEAPPPAADSTKPAPAPAARASSPPSAQGWVVQLGSFASRPNADKLAAELRGRGYTAFVSEFRGSGRVLFRVRVGPEQDRARADAVAARLAREGRKGTVAPHP